MPCPSLTTSDEEISHNPHRPKGLLQRFAPCSGLTGLRRHWPGFVVPAPRRWRNIEVVAAPRIRANGARNGRYRGFPTGPQNR